MTFFVVLAIYTRFIDVQKPFNHIENKKTI